MFFWIIFFVVVRGEFVTTKYACNATYQFFGYECALETTFSSEDILIRKDDKISGACLIKYGADRNMIRFFFNPERCKLEHDPTLAPNVTTSRVNLDRVTRVLQSEAGLWQSFHRTPEGILIKSLWKKAEEGDKYVFGDNIGWRFTAQQTCLIVT